MRPIWYSLCSISSNSTENKIFINQSKTCLYQNQPRGNGSYFFYDYRFIDFMKIMCFWFLYMYFYFVDCLQVGGHSVYFRDFTFLSLINEVNTRIAAFKWPIEIYTYRTITFIFIQATYYMFDIQTRALLLVNINTCSISIDKYIYVLFRQTGELFL
jgi:hypothetical protein